ncbi:leucyl/phenylalanyl-tRNA--protein transferase [Streptomyces sp. BE303]|uniref:leucyl/phenylalanyl-tRNA--protein transferase n=1 Tax=Streptomyces sp. BE303 TaxID=3002528 RepID=UPI002E76D529|nr:leucyl/phenylalanyl-tRNA--protein transferase [Streptomyces sp. BE303]MED7952485.1 leucyl/phenylalanyl-tRNA--protein transferase [Streptomyces sp. BE303]
MTAPDGGRATEPPSAAGLFDAVDVARAPADGPAAFGGTLEPDVLLAAYRRGLFPLPAADDYASAFNEARYEDAVAAGDVVLLPGPDHRDPYALGWWSPDPRPVIAPEQVRVGRKLSRLLRNRLGWWTSADRAFEEVLAACAEGREPPWLTAGLQEALVRLHRLGAAHSAEVWEGEELVGGVFGIVTGSVLSLDSMFHRRPDAARVAVADLATRFADAGGRLLDAQWDSPHVRTLGAAPAPRAHYLAELAHPARTGPLDTAAHPAARLTPRRPRHGGGHRAGPARPAGPAGSAGSAGSSPR